VTAFPLDVPRKRLEFCQDDWNMLEFKRKLSSKNVKFGLLGLASLAWLIGVVDELYASAGTMKYLLVSLLMSAIAFL
jgi:hypothetical protein